MAADAEGYSRVAGGAAVRAALALIAYDLAYWLLPPLRPWLERRFPGF